jgi:hypothetical protein
MRNLIRNTEPVELAGRVRNWNQACRLKEFKMYDEVDWLLPHYMTT